MTKTFQFNKPLPLIYILNNLELPEFSVDLWDLFGSEDNFTKALVGKWDAKIGNFKSITWDWSLSNIRHIFNIFYYLSCLKQKGTYEQEDFDHFYEKDVKYSRDLTEPLVEVGLTRPIVCLYVMKYKKQFPALLIEWEKITKELERKRPLLMTFRPIRYFMMDADTWNEAKSKSRDIQEWINTYDIPKTCIDEFSNIFQNTLIISNLFMGYY